MPFAGTLDLGGCVDVRAWPHLGLPRWLRVFICIVVLADAVAFVGRGSRVSVRAHDLRCLPRW